MTKAPLAQTPGFVLSSVDHLIVTGTLGQPDADPETPAPSEKSCGNAVGNIQFAPEDAALDDVDHGLCHMQHHF